MGTLLPKEKGKLHLDTGVSSKGGGKITSKSWTHLIYLPWQQQPRAAAGLARTLSFCQKPTTGDTPPIHLHRYSQPSCYTQSKIPVVTLTQKSKFHMPERCLSWNQMRLVREVKGSLFPLHVSSTCPKQTAVYPGMLRYQIIPKLLMPSFTPLLSQPYGNHAKETCAECGDTQVCHLL